MSPGPTISPELPETHRLSINVTVADAHPLMTSAILSTILSQHVHANMTPIKNSDDLFTTIASTTPKVLIADHCQHNFISLADIRTVRSQYPDIKILIFSADSDRRTIMEVLQLVDAYITKDAKPEEIYSGLDALLRGEKYFSQKILELMLDVSVRPEFIPQPSSLTDREKQTLRLLAKGFSTQAAADELHVSPHTIHSHRKKIIRKLGIQSPTQYVIHAIEMGLIEIGTKPSPF